MSKQRKMEWCLQPNQLPHGRETKTTGNWLVTMHLKDKIWRFFSERMLLVYAVLAFTPFQAAHADFIEIQGLTDRTQEIAATSKHQEITPLHLLAAILETASSQERTRTRRYVQEQLGIQQQDIVNALEKVRAELKSLPPLSNRTYPDSKPFDEFIKKAGELAEGNSRQLSLADILMQMYLTKNEAPSEILKSLKVDLGKLRDSTKFSPIPQEYLTDLTAASKIGNTLDTRRRNKYSTFTGREQEIERVSEALSSDIEQHDRTQRIHLLTGDSGSGKTATVLEVAKRIHDRDPSLPANLLGRRMLYLDMSEVVNEVKVPAKILSTVKDILDSATATPEDIIFVDQLNSLFGLKNGEAPLLPNIMKELVSDHRANPILAAGSSLLSAATKDLDSTTGNKIINLQIESPEDLELLEILEVRRQELEKKYEGKIKIPRHLLSEIAKLSKSHIKNTATLQSSLELLEEAVSLFSKMDALTEAPEAKSLRRQVGQLQLKLMQYEGMNPDDLKRAEKADREELIEELIKKEKEQKEIQSDWERGAALRQTLSKLNTQKPSSEDTEAWKKWHEEYTKASGDLKAIQGKQHFQYETPSLYHVAKVVSDKTGALLTAILGADAEKLNKAEDDLNKRVIAQPHATKAVANALRMMQTGMRDPKIPPSFIFAGPSGTGKTLTAEALAEITFGDKEALIEVDMQDFAEKHSISRLIGAPPGYVGFEEESKIVSQVRKRPFSVVLLDEIEKAHRDVFNVLLQILDRGRLYDQHGNMIDFSNTIVIMTTNLGVNELKAHLNKSEDELSLLMREILIDSKETRGFDGFRLRPEIVNRVGEIIVFNELDGPSLSKIFNIEMGKWRKNRVGLKGLEPLFSTLAENELIALSRQDAGKAGRGIRDLFREVVDVPIAIAKTSPETSTEIERHGRFKVSYDPNDRSFYISVPASADKDCAEDLAVLSQRFKPKQKVLEAPKTSELKPNQYKLKSNQPTGEESPIWTPSGND